MKTFEVNMTNIRKDEDYLSNARLNEKSPIVEIFSAITRGEDLSKYGKKVDAVVDRLKELSQQAMAGNFAAKAEINTIVRYALEPQLLKRIQLFSFMGTYKEIPYNEQPKVRTYKHSAIRSNFQAARGDVPFAITEWEEYPISTKTISSGYAVNYREIASGNLDRVAEGMEQVQTDMLNKAVYYVLMVMYNAIKNATGVKYFAEAQGVAKTSVDDILKKIRRFGRPTIMGDYSVLSQLISFSGFKADPQDTKATLLPEAVMEEIRRTGLLSTYNGAPVIELPNAYNLTQLNKNGDNFETYLPEGLLFFVPQGTVAPLQIFRRGGLTTMSGNDVVTGTELTRFDLEIGADVARGREYEIGLISDSNFDVPSV